jgi:hypothetical protein
LKSAFPEATWEWDSNNPERIIESGGKARVRLHNVPEFDFADITFDNMARILCDFLRIVPLANLRAKEGSMPENRPTGHPVDVAVWYNLQGKKALDDCIGNLNSRGYSELTIKENGDVCVQNSDKEFICVQLNNFPPKSLWAGLVDILNSKKFKASAHDDRIAVAW